MTKSPLSLASKFCISGSVMTLAAYGIGGAKASFQSKEVAFNESGAPYVKGELLVKTRSKAAVERFAAQTGEQFGMLVERTPVLEDGKGSAWYKVYVDENEPMESAFFAAQQDEDIEYVEPNFIYNTSLGGGKNPRNPPGGNAGPDYSPVPELPKDPVKDPQLEQLYGLKKINAQEAWSVERGSKDVVVADIDTGADYNHPDLINNVWRNAKEIPGDAIDNDKNGFVDDVTGYDFRDKDARPFDDNQHGSHTMGTIAATGGNGIGISGVAQNASVMVLRFLGGSEGSGTSEDAISCIEYATANGASIMSNSWGGGGFSQALFDAIKKASDKDILFVAAAGNASSNNDSTATYPVGYKLPNILGVAATGSKDELASFSNYGATTVHLAAPGVNILSAIPGGKYASFSGTSMAAPHVAGAAAILKSRFPKLTSKQLKEILMNSVDKVSSLDGKVITGGRLNLSKALQLAVGNEG